MAAYAKSNLIMASSRPEIIIIYSSLGFLLASFKVYQADVSFEIQQTDEIVFFI